MKKRIFLILFILIAVATVLALASCGHECDFSVEQTEAGTPATCLKSGVKVMKCSECEATKNEIIPALGHDYVPTVLAPTCDKGGYTTQKCSKCGDTNGDAKFDEKPATGAHAYVLVEGSKVEATCTQDGYELQKCSDCGKEKKVNIVTAPGHDFQLKYIYDNDKAPTCTESATGVTTKRCTVCNEKDPTFKDAAETYEALGHDIQHTDAYRIETKAATCSTAQHDKWECKREGCTGYTEEEDVGTPLGHDYSVEVPGAEGTVAATCHSYAKKQFACTRQGQTGCDAPLELVLRTMTDEGYAPHEYRAGATADCIHALTCIKCVDGGRTEINTNCDITDANCTNCSNAQKIHVFANPTGVHDYDIEQGTGLVADSTVAPTCMRRGYSLYDCSICKAEIEGTFSEESKSLVGNAPTTYTYKDNYTAIVLTAHNVDWTNPIEDGAVAETCIKYAYTVHACTNTSDDETQTCSYTAEKTTGTNFADHTFADGEPTGVITCTYCQRSFYDTTYVETEYKEYVEVEAGTGAYNRVETYVEATDGDYVLDEETQEYRLATDTETGTHKLVVSFESAENNDGNYDLKTWDGSEGTEFDENTSLNVTITVSKSEKDPVGLDSETTSAPVIDTENLDKTGITIIRVVSSDADTKYKITVNDKVYEITGSGYIDLHDYLDGTDPTDTEDDVTIETLKVEIVDAEGNAVTSFDGEATVYFYGTSAVPAEDPAQ